MTDTSAEAARKRAEEQLSAATAALVMQGNIEAEQADARKKEERALRKAAAAAAAASEGDGVVRTASGAVDGSVAAAKLRAMLDGGAAPGDVAAAVRALDVQGGLPAKMAALYEAVYLLAPGGGPVAPAQPDAEGSKMVDAVTAHGGVLRALAAAPLDQLAQLIALEFVCASAAPERIKELPLVLKVMYDEDLADEEIILAWASKDDAAKALGVSPEAAAAARAAAAPVVEWLEEADDDEDEDDQDDEDDQ